VNTRDLASPSRRNFLTATSAIGGGLLIGFGLPARGEVRDTLTTNSPFAPNAFLRIDRRAKSRSSARHRRWVRGPTPSLPMLIAEELEVDVDKVVIEHSPPDDKVYANPLIGAQLTGGSTSIRSTYVRCAVPARRRGHARDGSRAALERRSVHLSRAKGRGRTRPHRPQSWATASWSMPPPSCRCRRGRTQGAGRLQVDREHRTGVSTPLQGQRQCEFGIDTRLPGMKFAVVAASPTFGGRLVSVDEAKAKAVPGVSQVVRLTDAVRSGKPFTRGRRSKVLAAAAPQWDAGPNAKVSTAESLPSLPPHRKSPARSRRHDGDAAALLRGPRRRSTPSTSSPFLRTRRWSR